MERDYGLLSDFVKEDEKREKKQKSQDDSDFKTKINALKNMVKKYKLPDSLKLDIEGVDKDSLKFKEGMRKQREKKKALEKMMNRER